MQTFENEPVPTYKPVEKSIQDKVSGGGALSVYGAPTPHFNIGVYASVFTGKGKSIDIVEELPNVVELFSRTTQLGAGVAMKAGGRIGESRVWIGAGLGIGYNMTIADTSDNTLVFHGFEVVPQLSVDVLLLEKGRLKLALPIGVGASVVPFGVMKSDQYIYTHWNVRPTIQLGIAVGI